MKHTIVTLFIAAALLLLAIMAFFTSVPWWVFILPVFLWLLVVGWGSGIIASNYHIPALCSAAITQKRVAVTFDDGPGPETEIVLDLLKKYGAKATFFCIGRQIEKHPDIFRKILNEGHTVGNHSYSHSRRFGFFSTQHVIDELRRTDAIIEHQSGRKPRLFRPPFGVTTPSMAKAVKATGHTVIGWNIRSLDTVIKDEGHILGRIKNRLAPGSIILLHDTSEKSVRVLEQLLVLLQENGYEAIQADRLLNIPAYEE